MTTTSDHPEPRRSARTILQDGACRVLLLRFVVPRSDAPFVFWATPGGRVEAGESDIAAARREMREELGLDVPLTGPVHSATDRFQHEGDLVENTDVFFLGSCEADAPKLRGATDAERQAIREMRWWTLTEIEQSDETIFPRDLASAIRKLR